MVHSSCLVQLLLDSTLNSFSPAFLWSIIYSIYIFQTVIDACVHAFIMTPNGRKSVVK